MCKESVCGYQNGCVRRQQGCGFEGVNGVGVLR
jgi:hypothetical protein